MAVWGLYITSNKEFTQKKSNFIICTFDLIETMFIKLNFTIVLYNLNFKVCRTQHRKIHMMPLTTNLATN